jgi:hypothetical protein
LVMLSSASVVCPALLSLLLSICVKDDRQNPTFPSKLKGSRITSWLPTIRE